MEHNYKLHYFIPFKKFKILLCLKVGQDTGRVLEANMSWNPT